MARSFGIVVILLVYCVLAGLYATMTPYRASGVLLNQRDASGHLAKIPDIGAPDERQHANYIRHLMDGEGFPVLKPGSADLGETYQSHQPPAYYLLASAWSGALGANPVTEADGLKVRLLSIAIGALTVLGVYCAGLWGYGRVDVALAGTAIMGLMPMFIALNASVSNDGLLFCICTWTLALLGRALREKWSLAFGLLVGLLIGAGILTKTTAVALLPTAFLAIYLAHRKKAVPVSIWAVTLVLPLVIAAPWLLRNQSLYGDPLAMGVFKEAFVGSAKREQMIEMLSAMHRARQESDAGVPMEYWTQWFGWWTLRSFFGVFGYMDVFLSPFFYAAMSVLMAVLAFGWAGAVGKKDFNKPFNVVCLVFTLIIFALFLQFNLTYFQAQARYLYPAVCAVALGCGWGLCNWLGKRSGGAWVGAVLVMISVHGYALVQIKAGFEQRKTSTAVGQFLPKVLSSSSKTSYSL